jgi:transcription elongation factor Elf1
MLLVVAQGVKKFTCPADDCQKELEYKLTSQDLNRNRAHIRCPDCGLTIFFEIITDTQSGEVMIKGPKVLMIA